MKRCIVVALAIAALGGCSTTRGPIPALGLNGPARTDVTTGLPKAFIDSEGKSFANQSDAALADKMLTDGFALVYGNCSDFFASAGETQKWVIVTRDAVGAVGTLGTSVLALHGGSKNAVANWALATGITFSGLDIYTKNFLFAAENVDSVRTLVANALIAHQKGVSSLAPFTYQSATMHLLDNQDVCTPAAIAALARAAIKKGDVAAAVTSVVGETGIRQLGDQAVLQSIGTLLNPPGPVTADQAGALWWLLREFSTTAEKSKIIAPKLVDLPAASQPFDQTGAYQAGWKFAGSVGQALDKLSNETRESFRSAIAGARSAATPPAGPASAAAPPVPGTVIPLKQMPTFAVAAPSGSSRATHVSVGIR